MLSSDGGSHIRGAMHRATWAVGTALAAIGLTCSSPRDEPDRLVAFVRHAEKAVEPTNDPPLTQQGRDRAGALAAALETAHVGAVISTPFRRTIETAEPLTTSLGLTPTVVDVAGGLPQHIEAVTQAVRARPPGEAVLVVGHSNTIPAIIGALGGPTLPDLCEGQYADLFIMLLPARGPPRLVHASYGEPDAPESDSCH